MTPFIGFAPDAPPETPGIFTDCSNIIPDMSGFIAAPTPVDPGHSAISSAALGFAVTKKLDGTIRVFCGNSSKLYEQSGNSWSDKSKALGYSLGPDDRWRFAQYGNITLATSKSSTLQFIDVGSTFADASGSAPKAAIVETINNQVFLFNIDGMGFGSDVTRWACSAVGSYTDWTPAVATQCTSGQLLDSPGAITAGKQLGDIIVAYKEAAMYVGQYVGGDVIWDFRRVPGDVGAPSQEAVVSTGTAHFFVGTDDFYVFDGSRPVALNSPCRNWFFSNADKRYMYKICGTYDRVNQRVYWWFCSLSSNGVLDKCVVYNVRTNQWGRSDLQVEFVADYVAGGLTFEGIGAKYSTYDDLPTDISFDSPYWTSNGSIVAVFKTDHKVYQLSGVPEMSRFVTGHYGDNLQFSTITRVRPMFIKTPESSYINYSYSCSCNGEFTNKLVAYYRNNWYDLLWSARWHKMEFVNHGQMKISGIDVLMSPDGVE